MRREHSLNSSATSSAGYDDETQTMDVTFTSGQTYTLQGVPANVFEEFVSSPSPGSYWHRSLKGRY
jgi:hypothetical protein